jgi:hypothetical protein
VVNINIYIYYTKIYVTLYNLKCIVLCYEDQLFLHFNFCTLKHCVYRIMYVSICSWKNKQITKKEVFPGSLPDLSALVNQISCLAPLNSQFKNK